MRHLGDITKINGAEIEPVDVVTGGSPCQNLSIAGNREGLQGKESRLFLEQIRVIKEMREADEQRGRANQFIRPRYMVWENVCGAFSSNKGADFRKVLEETAKIKDKTTVIPEPPKGKWRNAGCILADGWSVAWRVFDAQFWGVPQRRRRIALVADFGGDSAPEILFERKGVSGNIAPGRAEKEGIASYAERGIAETDRRRYAELIGNAGAQSDSIAYAENCAPTLKSSLRMHLLVYDARGNGSGEVVPTITGDHENRITDYTAIIVNCTASEVDSAGYVRRFTPLECERLQGYPDGWTDIANASDTARYKALGNSIALPPWTWLMRRILAMYQTPPTLGSLFDGIGGFPLIWERIKGRGSALWASETDKFVRRVTELRIGGNEND